MSFVDKNPEIVFEEIGCVEVGVGFERLFCDFKVSDSVESEDAEFVVLGRFPEEIPSLQECFQAVRFYKKGVAFCFVERVVCHQKREVVFDGFDDGLKVLQSGGNFFQYEAVFDGEAVNEDVVYGQGLQHPALGGVVAKYFGVANVVLVVISRVAYDVDVEHVVDSLSEAVEGGSGEWFPVVEVVFDPQFLDVFEADFLRDQDDVDEPDVLAEGVGVSHGLCFLQR